jgi:methyl-accepting chemotaxis protein
MIIMHIKLINNYKSITENLIVEHEFMQRVPELVQSYGNVVNSPKSKERLDKYNEVYVDIENSILLMDERIIYKESRLPYSSLKNIAKNLMSECDKGIDDILHDNLTSAFKRYEYVSSKTQLIESSTSTLMGKELEYAHQLQDKINTVNRHVMILGALFLIIVLLLCMVFVFAFSRRLTNPMVELALLTKEISQGNLSLRVDKKLLENEDETGILSKSIDDMINRINKEIDAQKKISEDLENSKKALMGRNEELEKFNKMVVDRELKMTELKGKIAVLEQKLQQNK